MNIHSIYEKMSDVCERLGRMEAAQEYNNSRVDELAEYMTEMRDNANRLKGAFMLSMIIGGALGTIVTAWHKMKEFFS